MVVSTGPVGTVEYVRATAAPTFDAGRCASEHREKNIRNDESIKLQGWENAIAG